MTIDNDDGDACVIVVAMTITNIIDIFSVTSSR